MPRKKIAIDLGGSMVNPDGNINFEYLKKFRMFVIRLLDSGYDMTITVGGGGAAGHYIGMLPHLPVPNQLPEEAADLVGIAVTRLNAEIVRLLLHDVACNNVFTHPNDIPTDLECSVAVTGGFVPGQSTDACSVQCALRIGATDVIRLTNTPGVYTADPNKDSGAELIPKLSWKRLRREIIPSKWTARMSSPFDPVGAKLAEENGISAYVVHAEKFEVIYPALQGKSFEGSLIHP